MKKVVVIAILIIGIVGIKMCFSLKTVDPDISTNKINIEDYVDKSYLQNIVKYKIARYTTSEDLPILVNVIDENDIESIKNLFVESDKIDFYSYENDMPEFYMIAYLLDNSAIKIEGAKDEVKITSVDDEDAVEYYKFRLENDFQEYLNRKYIKYAKNVKYYLYKENDKFGIIDSYNDIVFDPKYDDIKIINSNTDLFLCTIGDEKMFLDKNEKEYFINIGEKISEIQITGIEEKMYCDILTYERNKKYGLLNIKGEKISELEYDNIYSLGNIENYIILEKKDSKKQLCSVNLNGIEIIAEYDEISIRKDETEQEYIIFGKNEHEDEQVILFEKIKDNIENYPETLENLHRTYENGIYFYKEIPVEVVVPENEQI